MSNIKMKLKKIYHETMLKINNDIEDNFNYALIETKRIIKKDSSFKSINNINLTERCNESVFDEKYEKLKNDNTSLNRKLITNRINIPLPKSKIKTNYEKYKDSKINTLSDKNKLALYNIPHRNDKYRNSQINTNSSLINYSYSNKSLLEKKQTSHSKNNSLTELGALLDIKFKDIKNNQPGKFSNTILQNKKNISFIRKKINENIVKIEKECNTMNINNIIINKLPRTLNTHLFEFNSNEYKFVTPARRSSSKKKIENHIRNKNLLTFKTIK